MQKITVAPSLLQRAMKATGTKTAQAAIRQALLLTVQRADLRALESTVRPGAVRRARRAIRGRITILRDARHLRKLIGA